jgi:hypothetical protein
MDAMTTRRITTALLTIAMIAALQTSSRAQFGPRGFGGADQEMKVVDRYDKDRDGRLNREERRAARTALRGVVNDGPFRGFRGGGGSAAPGMKLTPADVKPPYPKTPIYDLGTLRTFFLEFEDADWESELTTFYNTDVEVPATMIVDGRTYRDVGVHFRGASSFRMVPEGYKRSLNISMDFANQKQDLGSYQTLNLLNANNDPTFLRAMLYTEISRRFLPTPKMNFVRVVINGENWGVYLNAQQFNSDFVKEWFKVNEGARWKAPGSPRGRAGLEYLGDNPALYKQVYEIKSKDTPESWAALIKLTEVLNSTPVDKLEAALAPHLDIDGALRFMAVEVALVNTDGYWTRASDYNLYRDPSGRFHIIPHDVNEGLGSGGGFGGGRGPNLDPLIAASDPTKPLYSKLLAVPALRQKYLGYVREIGEKWLDWNTALQPIARAAHDLIAADVRADTRKIYDNAGFAAGVARDGNQLKDFVDARRAFLLQATAPGRTRVVNDRTSPSLLDQERRRRTDQLLIDREIPVSPLRPGDPRGRR